jgi:hypothetical protein
MKTIRVSSDKFRPFFPKFWTNFISENIKPPMSLIRELQTYSAVYVLDEHNLEAYLVFSNDEGYTEFMLRFG